MFRRILRVPFVPLLLTMFALAAFAVSVSHAQCLYVSNVGNNQVIQLTLTGRETTVFTDTNAVRGIAFDTSGTLWVVDHATNTVSKLLANGTLMPSVTTGLSSPEDLALDTSGNLYCSNAVSGTIAKITPTGSVSTFASGLNNPLGIAFDSSGNLYVASNGDNTIRKITPTQQITKFAVGLSSPTSLTFDPSGNLYVCNNGGTTVSKINSSGVVSTFASGLNVPTGIASDTTGNIYVTTSGDNTLRRFTPTGTASVVAVGFNNPVWVTFHQTGAIFGGTLALQGIASSAAPQNVTFTFRPNDNSGNVAQSISVSPAGSFNIYNFNFPTKSGVLHIKGDKYLAVNVNADATGGSVTGIVATLSAGDATNDNVVNTADFNALIGAFGSSASVAGSGYDVTADFNGDGSIDTADFNLLIGEFGNSGDP